MEGAVEVYIQNWRCVEELKLSLGRINVFIGPNASGKSSVAYSVYLAARMPQNLAAFVAQLYGYGFDKLTRNVGGRAQYPVVIRLDDAEIRVEEGGKLATSSRGTGEAYLLPARRLAYLQVMLTIHKAMGEVVKKPEAFLVAGFASFFAEVLKSLPVVLPLPVFISDYLRGVAGIDIEPQMGGVSGVGAFVLKTAPVFSLLEFTYRDPYVELELPLDLVASSLSRPREYCGREIRGRHPGGRDRQEFIKAALTATRHEDVVYLVTYDSGLLRVDLGKLRERYQEAVKVKIVEPKEAVERLKSAGSR